MSKDKEKNEVVMSIDNCMDCQFHDVIYDPDPDDWFCDDDVAVVCTKVKRSAKSSRYAADRQEYRPITVGCRPYNKRKECNVPDWCPLLKKNK